MGGPVRTEAVVGRRLLLRGAVSAPLAPAVAGCGPALRRNGRGPVTLATGKDLTGYLPGVLAEWNRRRPRERVRLVELPESADETHAQLADGLVGGGSRFDVLNIDVSWTARFASRGWIRPLEPGRSDEDGLLPQVRRSGTYRGGVYAAPYVTDAGLLYYRSDVLEAAGERPPVTWRELVRQASVLAPEAGLHGYAGQFLPYEGLTVNVLEAVASAGGSLVRTDDGCPEGLSPRVAAGLRFLADGVRAGWIPRAALGFKEEESRRAFGAGRLLFLRNWPYAHARLQHGTSAVAGRFGVVRLPGPAGPGRPVLGGSGLALAAGSAHPRTAADLIAHLTGEEVQRRVLEVGGLPPVREDLYRDRELIARHPWLPVLRQSLARAVPRPAVPWYGQVSLVVTAVVHDLLNGRTSVPDAERRLLGELRALGPCD
ncbi:ABC transporter substrate-binding protein [Streptomyces sp. NPDC035033]|uniref:ABC transporter substrate-binding protein n=1 Tax=Streptomyces sp. NPDC035033 TaxID=3155368 RepID=UPI0034032BFB